MNEQLISIQEAYAGIISESIKPYFKVGDVVGIGRHWNYDPLNYNAIDTGIVSKVDKLGNHTVAFDNQKSNDDPSNPMTHKFGSTGVSLTQGDSLKIIPKESHNNLVKYSKENNDRSYEINSMLTQVAALKNGYGKFPKFRKEHAEQIKALIDKHTEA